MDDALLVFFGVAAIAAGVAGAGLLGRFIIFALNGLAARDVDAGRPAATICRWETRGHPDPDRARGAHGEVGWCQIKVSTAALVLGVDPDEWGEELAWLLEHRPITVRIGEAYLADWCRSRYTERALYCWNAGHNARWDGPTGYTKNVMTRLPKPRMRRET